MAVGTKIMLKKAESHLYTLIKVARGEDLRKQIGKNIYFDLVDHDKVRSFQILKQFPFNLFKEEYAKALGIPVESQCFWVWSKRPNQSYRPHRRLTPEEEAKNVGELSKVFDKNNSELKLFLELECKQDYHLPPLNKGEKDILLFFKLYDPEKEQLRYVGRFLVKSFDKPVEILTKLNALAGFASDEKIELFEEVMFEPKVVCKRLDMAASFESSEIKDGDIICFQKQPTPQIEEQVTFPRVFSFLNYVKYRQLQEAEKKIPVPLSDLAEVPQMAQAENSVTKEEQPVVEPKESCFTWTINGFNDLDVDEFHSNIFVFDGYKWKISILRNEVIGVDFLSINLSVVNIDHLPNDWNMLTKFSFAVINQFDSDKPMKKGKHCVFTHQHKSRGYEKFATLEDIKDPSKGFVVNDKIIFEVDVDLKCDVIQPKKKTA